MFALCALAGTVNAQNPVFLKIRAILAEKHPEVNFNEKLIAYSAWTLDDQESRKTNADFGKTTGIFRVARLKGGRMGMVGVSVCLDASKATALTTLSYDGVTELIVIDFADLRRELKGAPANMIFDAEGRELYRGLSSGQVFEAVNNLITR
jgi:hypothetical protein